MEQSAQPSTPDELLQARRKSLQQMTGRPLRQPEADGSPLPEERRQYLLGEAQDLYWNDLEWENVTGEEELEGGPLTELTFPGVLAYTRGLLLTEVPSDSPVGPAPRPQVVEEFLAFLAERVLTLQGRSGDGTKADPDALRMTSELLDQVLMVYHGVSPEDVGPLGPSEMMTDQESASDDG